MDRFSRLTWLYGIKLIDIMEIVKMDTTANLEKVQNPLVIYHGNCADGFGAAWVFYHMQDRIQQNFDFHPGVYNEAPPDVKDRIVYLVDFSYKRAVVEKMLASATHIYFIDHHKTAIEDICINEPYVDTPIEMKFPGKFTAYVDLERSGAMLAWDFWNNTKWMDKNGIDVLAMEIKPGDPAYVNPPRLLDHIQDRDLWKFKLPNTREIQANLFSHPYDFKVWDNLMHAGPIELLHHTVAGAAIERKHFKDIKELVDVCRRLLPIGPHLVPVASLPYTFSSDAGHIMAEGYENGTKFAACYWDTPSHRIFSLRSCPNGIDVSEVAAGYGGGGHRNAAGFRVPRDHILAIS